MFKTRKIIVLVKKSIKIPVHYDTTKAKLSILDRLTARITYCIMLISGLITEGTEIDRPTIRKLVKENDIVSITGLSAGFIDQSISHSCGAKVDADFNAAYNISEKVNLTAVWMYNSSIEYALRCRDDRLKAGMNMEKIYASL